MKKKLTIINAATDAFWVMPDSFIEMIKAKLPHWEIRLLKRLEVELPLLQDAHAIIGLPFSAHLIRGNPHLEWVHFLSAQVPLSWQKLTDQYLITKSEAGGDGVSEHALFLALKGLRAEAFDLARTWDNKNFSQARLMSESKLGIMGLGNIGESLVEKTLPLFNEVRVLTHRTSYQEMVKLYPYSEMESFFCDLDAVILCTAYTKKNQEIFHDAKLYHYLSHQVILVNVARGELLKTADLINFLKAHPAARYLSDVATPEPYPDEGELWELNNVYLSPHVGAKFNTLWERLTAECMKIIKVRDV